MNLSAVHTMNLKGAYLCSDFDCRTISNQSQECPYCHCQVIKLEWLIDLTPEERAEYLEGIRGGKAA